MSQLTNKEFIDFIESFKDEFYIPITEISKSMGDRNESLVVNDFQMYSLDDICKKSLKFKNNLPKTTDAIFYRIDNENKMIFYIIEFKFYNLERESTYNVLDVIYEKLEKKNQQTFEYSNKKIISDGLLNKFELIKNNFVDSVEVSLRLKPIETIMVALPILYEEYCEKNNITPKNLEEYLKNIDVKFYIFFNRYDKNISADRFFGHSVENKLKHQFERLKMVNIINDYFIRTRGEFDVFIKQF